MRKLLILAIPLILVLFIGWGEWPGTGTIRGDKTFTDSTTMDKLVVQGKAAFGDTITLKGGAKITNVHADTATITETIVKIAGKGIVTGDLLAPKFLDSDNIIYYLNPAVRSYLNGLSMVTLGVGYEQVGANNEWARFGAGKALMQFATGDFDDIWSRLFTTTTGGQILRCTGGVTWEHDWVLDGHLVEVKDTLWVYYIGKGDSIRIGRAYSLDDGGSWRKDPSNPLMSPNGTGCEKKLWECTVKYEKIGEEATKTWQMYYQAYDSVNAVNTLWATSVDGKTWTRRNLNRPVLWNSDWDVGYCGVRNICYRNDSIFLFYEGVDAGGYMQLGSAVGTDESTFVKLETSQPTLSVIGTPDTLWAGKSIIPVVELVDNIFICWYGANDVHFPGYNKIGMAFSYDGKNWTRYQGNPAYDLANFGVYATAAIDIYWKNGKLRGTTRQSAVGISFFLIKESQIAQFANESGRAMSVNWGDWSVSGNDTIQVDSTQFRSVINGVEKIKWDNTGVQIGGGGAIAKVVKVGSHLAIILTGSDTLWAAADTTNF